MDIDRLRKHYESLSDEALLEINREELVAAACVVLDAEIAARGLNEAVEFEDGETPRASAVSVQIDEDWLGEAAVAFSVPVDPRRDRSEEMDRACAVLEAAGIAHDVNVRAVEGGHDLDLLVPSKLILEAASVLDRDVFNAQLEEGWSNHFAALSDEELAAVDIRLLTAGWADRIDRLTRAYKEERAKRG